MTLALICSEADLDAELSRTLLWRDGIERHAAGSLDQARLMATAVRPDLVLVDRDLPGAAELVAALRRDDGTRGASIAVLARGDFDTQEVELLEAGANAVLRLPPGEDWEERLKILIEVPARREARFPVSFAVEALLPPAEPVAGTALNISRHGLLVETQLDALGVGAEVRLRMSLPGAPQPLMGRGRVVRVAGPGRFGLQFTELAAPVQREIDSFVDAAAA